MEKQNLTQQKHTLTNQKNVQQHKQEGQHPLTGQRALPISGGT